MVNFAFNFEDEAGALDDSDTPAEAPSDPPAAAPDVMLDTDAHFEQTESGVVIDVGDDETGSLAVIYYTDTEDNPDDPIEVNEARFYLVPEGVDWSSASWETRFDVPGADTYEGAYSDYPLTAFKTEYGLELLGVVDLKAEDGEADAPANHVRDITSNQPIEEYYLNAQTDGDELLSFLPVDYVITGDGVTKVSVLTDTTGTDATDWLSANAAGITVDGAGGVDYLETSNANVPLIGGLGDDHISTSGSDVVVEAGEGDDHVNAYTGTATVDGGAGNDRINIGSGTATGGEGNDALHGYGGDDGPALLYGEAGDDNVIVSEAGSQAYGGDSADFVSVGNDAVGHGDAGEIAITS